MTPRRKIIATAIGSALVLLAAAGAHIVMNLTRLTFIQATVASLATLIVAAGIVCWACKAQVDAKATLEAILAEELQR